MFVSISISRLGDYTIPPLIAIKTYRFGSVRPGVELDPACVPGVDMLRRLFSDPVWRAADYTALPGFGKPESQTGYDGSIYASFFPDLPGFHHNLPV